MLRPRCGIGGNLGTLNGSKIGSPSSEDKERKEKEKNILKCWDSDAGIGTLSDKSVLASDLCCSLSKMDRQASNASAPSPKIGTSIKSKEYLSDLSKELAKKRLINIATISTDSPCLRFESELKCRGLAPCLLASDRRSHPDLSPNATLSSRNSNPLSLLSPRPDIFVTNCPCDISSPFEMKLSSRAKSGTHQPLSFHRSSPHIPLSRTPSPSHSIHSVDAHSSPFSSPVSGYRSPLPSPSHTSLPSSILVSYGEHKRRRSNSNSGSANEKLL